MLLFKPTHAAAIALVGSLTFGIAPAASAVPTSSHSSTARQALDKRVKNHPALVTGLIETTSTELQDSVVRAGDTLLAPAKASGDSTLFMPGDFSESLSLSTPNAVSTTVEGGVVTQETSTGATTISHLTTAGNLQITAVLDSPSEQFAVNLAADDNSRWVPSNDGGLHLVDASGEASASIARPWAVDRTGRQLPTHFEVQGDTIIQQIDFKDAVFPVVADPSVAWWVATGAKCAGEILTTFGPLAATKIARIAKNISALALKSKAVATAVSKLGGAKNAAWALVKLAVLKVKESRVGKYVKGLPSVSLSAEQRKWASAIWGFASANIWGFLGFGSCGEMLAQA